MSKECQLKIRGVTIECFLVQGLMLGAQRFNAMANSPSLIKSIQDIRNSSTKISQRLKAALSEDALAKELLESEPETFDEIDERFRLLSERIIHSCGLVAY